MNPPVPADTQARSALRRILAECDVGGAYLPDFLVRDASQALLADASALMTFAEVAAALGCSERTIYRLVADHGLPVVRHAHRATRIERAALAVWIGDEPAAPRPARITGPAEAAATY